MTDLAKKRALIAMLCVLCILLGIYFALCRWNRQQSGKEEEEKISVTDTDAAQINTFSFNTGEKTLSFEKEDGSWYYTDDRDFPLDQDKAEGIAEKISGITADRELKNGDSHAAYGLDEPSYTFAYTDVNGNSVKIEFGNMTGDDYYAAVDGEETVYTVPSSTVDAMDYSLDDLAVLDEYPSIGSGNLLRETITRSGETLTYDSEDEDQEKDIAAVAGGLGAVELSEAADYSVEDGNLGKYGLDKTSRITVEAVYSENDKEKTLTLYIGDEDGDGNRYVMINDSRIVYLISDKVCQNILNE